MTPGSEEGARITQYVGEDSAEETLPGGKHALVQSSVPLRSAVGSGQLAPVSLALEEHGGWYVPVNPLLPISISKSAADGVSFPFGVGVAPAQAREGEGTEVVGDRVVYPGTAPDTDFMVEPLPEGVETSWQLLSQASSEENGLVFSLPTGASLRMSTTVQGGAEVVDGGQAVLAIPPASAREADGVALPATYTVNGDTLTTHVNLSESVDYPVLVDPTIVGFFGANEDVNVWTNWQNASNCGCFGFPEYGNVLQAGTNPGPAEGDYGDWYIYAPGAGTEGGASITRVDISGLTHESADQSYIQAEIGRSNGTEPIYSFNGTDGASGASPLWTPEAYSNIPIAFCAQQGGKGGHDGGSIPLCDENVGGQYFLFEDSLGPAPRTVYNYVQIAGASVTYLDETQPNEVRLSAIDNYWTKEPLSGSIIANDQGVGIESFSVEIPPGHLNEKGQPYFAESLACSSSDGFSGCPHQGISSEVSFSGLATGIYNIGVYAYDATGNIREERVDPADEEELKSSEDPKEYIDRTPPKIGSLTGSLAEANGHWIGGGNYTLNFSAEDGNSGAPQSGIYKLYVAVDGRNVATDTTSCPVPRGVPAPNCFDFSGSWTMEGQKYGVGLHTITVTAEDWAGNESSESIHVTVNEAPRQQLGPGSVNLKTGAYTLNAADVAVAGAAGELAVSRSYNSRELMQGASPLGPQWSLSLPDAAGGGVWKNLQTMPNGSAQLTTGTGEEVTFVASGGGYTSPPGYQTDTLTGPSKGGEYTLTNAVGDATLFARTSGEKEEAAVYVPSGVEQASGAGGLNKTTYLFTKTSEGIIEPTRVIAPHPSKIECNTEVVAGCRVLTFNYATTTTATGENESQWGDYKGHLTRVYFTTWNLATKKPTEPITVAQYAYDAQGRLRAEWNPELASPLKTTYGYDAEGHVTALTLPGQESWAFTYGTTAGDSNAGRLLKVMQAPASTSLWGGEPPKNTEVPKLSGSPVVGVTMGVSSGAWSNAPVAYSYQWQDCNSEGKACMAILGATNANYTVVSNDVGHTLVALVSATNGGGSVATPSAPSASATSTIAEYSLPGGSHSFGITAGPEGNLWFTESGLGTVGKITTGGTTSQYAANDDEPEGITAGPDGNLWFVEHVVRNVDHMVPGTGALTTYTLTRTSTSNVGITAGPDGNLWFTESATSFIGKITTKDEVTGEYALPTGSEPQQITSGPDKNLWFADYGTSKIGKITTSGTITEYSLPAGSKPYGITAGPDGNLWFTDYGTSKIGKITTSGTITEYALPSGSDPRGITAGPEGDLWFTDYGTSEIGKSTTSGTITEYALPSGSEPYGITAGSDKNIWFTEYGTSRIGKMILSTTAGTKYGAGPGWTVEYNVPLTGGATGLPTMTKAEVEKWDQKEDPPAEATAIFPPNKLTGWPAAEYTGATIYYRDSAERTVDVSRPTGGISTTEYNSHNNIVRALSADDRATALKESKPAEAADKLSTISTYNSEGTELESTLGPEHEIKLQGASSPTKARKYVKYTYNQGMPSEGGPYELVTSTTETAKLASGEEKEPRTTSDSYSGQEGLGWKLRVPTSTTTSPGDLDLTHKTIYSATTGEPLETMTPAGASEHRPTYSLQFGTEGTGNGQFKHSADVVVDNKGHIWVLDESNSRIEEFNENGEYLSTIGSSGTGNGQLKTPAALAIDSKGNLWVADTGNNRVEEFNEKGGYVTKFGTLGTGSGELDQPEGIAIDPKGNIWVADTSNDRVEEFNENGEDARIVGTSGPGKLGRPEGIASDSKGDVWVADWSNDDIKEFNEKDEYVTAVGTAGTGNGQLTNPDGVTLDAAGNIWITDTTNNRVEELNTKGEYLTQFGAKGSGAGQFNFSAPTGLAVDSKGDIWVADASNNRVEKWLPSTKASGNEGAHDSEIIYYAPENESSITACNKHPEWANLPCQTQAAHQPETTGLPELPTTTYTYNIWLEPEVTNTTSGTATRTETDTYDNTGRLTSKELTSTTGTTLPKVNYEYSKETGALIKRSDAVEGQTQSIRDAYNKLGQLTSYITEADELENVATYEYEKEKAYRLTKVNDGKGTQTYSYNETTGLMSELNDSSSEHMKLTATYDSEGNLFTEIYPNGMIAADTYNSVGEPISREYVKTTHCTEKCTWYSDSVIPSIHGQSVSQTSTLSKETYAYSEAGWLTQTEETPTGQRCTARIYNDEEDGNRMDLTKRESPSEACADVEGGTEEKHAYDTADRLTDAGIEYNPFGDITTLPTADADGSTLTSRFYTDGQLAEQEQAGETLGYRLDPARRTRETVSTGSTTSDIQNYYASEGDAPAWSAESGSKWERYIAGISGAMTATQTNGEAPILELSDLDGDIIGTASMSETATAPTSMTGTTEYGVPAASTPPRYSWQGTQEIPTELPSGVTAMGARSYIPEIGRFLQPDPKPGGSVNSYAYTYGDPLNESDATGQWSLDETSGGLSAVGTGEGTKLAGGEGIAAGAVMPPPTNVQAEEEFAADPPWDQATAGTEEYEPPEEPEEEGGGYKPSRHSNNEDPGLPPGAQCEGAVDSKKYKKEHKKLCHEIESNPWEPADAFCISVGWTVPFTGYLCGAYGAARATTK